MQMPVAIATDARIVPNPRAKLFWRTLVNLRTSLVWAWLDTKCQYRRSKVGPLWETINVAVMIAAISLVSSGLFGGKMEDLIGYIGLGLIIWSAIAGLVVDGCGTFVRNVGHILASNISVDLYVGRTLFKNFITFGHHILLYSLVGIALGLIPIDMDCVALDTRHCTSARQWILGYHRSCVHLCAVSRRRTNCAQSAPDCIPSYASVLELSADRAQSAVHGGLQLLFHFLQIIRLPLLGEIPSGRTYLIVFATTVLGYVVAAGVYYRMRRRLAFFV